MEAPKNQVFREHPECVCLRGSQVMQQSENESSWEPKNNHSEKGLMMGELTHTQVPASKEAKHQFL